MIWTAIVGIALGALLVHGESQKVREAKAKIRRRKRAKEKAERKPRKPRKRTIQTKSSYVNGVMADLEELVLIDDFEEEVLEE